MATASASKEGTEAAKASVKETRRIHRAQAIIEEASTRRRHYLRIANDEGLTYKELATMNGVATSVVGDAIGQARGEDAPEGL